MQSRSGFPAAAVTRTRHSECTAAATAAAATTVKRHTQPLPPISTVLRDARKQPRLLHLDQLFTLIEVTPLLDTSAQTLDATASSKPIGAEPRTQSPVGPRNSSRSSSIEHDSARSTKGSGAVLDQRLTEGQKGSSGSIRRSSSSSSSQASTAHSTSSKISSARTTTTSTSTTTTTTPRPSRSSPTNSQDTESLSNASAKHHPHTVSRNNQSSQPVSDSPHKQTADQQSQLHSHPSTNHRRRGTSSRQPSTKSTPNRTAPSASCRLMSQYIKSCRSLQELDETFRRCDSSSLNVVHLTAIASAIAKAGSETPDSPGSSSSSSSSGRGSSSNGQTYSSQSEQRRQRSASSSTNSRALRGPPSPAASLLLEVLSAATSEFNAPDLRPRELSTLVWASAKLFGSEIPTLDPQQNAGSTAEFSSTLSSPLSRDHLTSNPSLAARSTASGRQISRVTADVRSQRLMMGLQPVLEKSSTAGWLPVLLELIYQQAGDFRSQDVSMTLWALATLQPDSKSSSSSSAYGSSSYDLSSTGSTSDRRDREYARDRASNPRLEVENAERGDSSAVASPALTNSDRVVQRLLDACLPHLGAFGPQAMSNTLWALATLSVRPSDNFLSSFCSASLRQLPDFGAQALANTTWAMVVLDFLPPAEWRNACMASSLDAVRYAPPRAVAQIVWAVARMRFPEAVASPAWLAGMLETLVGKDGINGSSSGSSSNKLNGCSSQDLANIIYATARLSTQLLTMPLLIPQPHLPSALSSRPPLHFMHAFLDAAFSPSRLSSYSPHELPAVLTALATLRFCPPPDMLGAALEAFSHSMAAASAQGLSNVLWAVARLGARPSGEFLDEMVMTLSTKLDDVGPQENANIWWALGSLRWQPGPSAGSELLLELSHKLDDCTSSEIAMALWGIARLDIPLPKLLLDRYVSKLGQAKHSADDIPWALPVPSKLYKQILAQELSSSGRNNNNNSSSSSSKGFETSASSSAMSNQSSSSSSGGQSLPSFTRRSSAMRTQRTGGELHPRTLCTVLWSLSRMDADTSRTAAMGLAYRSIPTLPRFSPADSSIVIYSLARLGCLSLNETFIYKYCLATAPLLSRKAYSSQDLFMSAWGIARLGKAPTAGWLRVLLAEAGRQARLASNRQLVMLLWSLGRIASQHPRAMRMCHTGGGLAAVAQLSKAIQQRLPPLLLPSAAQQARAVSHVRLQYQQRHKLRQQLEHQPQTTPSQAAMSRSLKSAASPANAPHSMATTAFSSGTSASLLAAPLRVNTLSTSPRYNPSGNTLDPPIPPTSLFSLPVMVQLNTLSPRPARRTLNDAYTSSSTDTPSSPIPPTSFPTTHNDVSSHISTNPIYQASSHAANTKAKSTAAAAVSAAASTVAEGVSTDPIPNHAPLTPRDLTHILTAFVDLKMPIPLPVLEQLLSAMSASLEQYKPEDLCYSLRSLSRLCPRPAVPVQLLQASLNHAAYHIKSLTSQNVEMLVPAVCALAGWTLEELKTGSASGVLRSSDRKRQIADSTGRTSAGVTITTADSLVRKAQLPVSRGMGGVGSSRVGGAQMSVVGSPTAKAAVVVGWPVKHNAKRAVGVVSVGVKAGVQADSSKSINTRGSSSSKVAGSSHVVDGGGVKLEGGLLRLRMQLRWLWVAHKGAKHKAVLLRRTSIRFSKERWLRSRQSGPFQGYQGQGISRSRSEYRDW